MDFMYGQLNKIVEKVEYEGIKSPTADVTVDNENCTIKVDVTKSPEAQYTGLTTDTIKVTVDNDADTIKADIVGDVGKTYTGETSPTATVTVDNINDTIKVDVFGGTEASYNGGSTETIRVNVDNVERIITADLLADTGTTYSGLTTSTAKVTVDNDADTIKVDVIGDFSKVDDVKVNGQSVVSNKIANVTVPIFLNQLTQDANHQTVTNAEKVNWNNHINNTNNPHNVTKSQLGLSDIINAGMDPIPLSGSNNYVKSGGVYEAIDDVDYYLDVHTRNKNNPHQVSKSQVGLGSVVNAGMDDEATEDSTNYISSGAVYDAVDAVNADLAIHVGDYENPHRVTKSQLGLSSVQNRGLDTTVRPGSNNYITSGAVSTAVEPIIASVDNLSESIASIEAKIPNDASSNNQLADKAFVNSSVQTATANFRGNWPDWLSVPTNSSEYPVDQTGSRVPKVNDYLVVRDVSDYTDMQITGSWRFKYSGVWSTDGKNGWNPEYQLNTSTFTQDQLNALDSGITSNLVEKITSTETVVNEHIADKSNPHEVTKQQVGLGNVENLAPYEMDVQSAASLTTPVFVKIVDPLSNPPTPYLGEEFDGSANLNIPLPNSVVMTSGNQSIGGNKTFDSRTSFVTGIADGKTGNNFDFPSTGGTFALISDIDAFRDPRGVIVSVEDTTGSSLKYNYYNNYTAAVIYDNSYNTLQAVRIPKYVRNSEDKYWYKVESINSEAFRDLTNINNVILPDSITSIGSLAFSGCSNLSTININENSIITTIGDNAFANCNLTSILLPRTLTTIGTSAFSDNPYLTSITILRDNDSVITDTYNNKWGATNATIIYYRPVTDSQISNWNAKQNALPAVTNDRYLHTNNSTGELEWAELDIPTVVQDLTQSAVTTLTSGNWSTLKTNHYLKVDNVTINNLSDIYDFVNIKLIINNNDQFVKLSKNTTNKYSGLFFIEETIALNTSIYELTVYYSGTSLILRCAQVY